MDVGTIFFLIVIDMHGFNSLIFFTDTIMHEMKKKKLMHLL